MDMIAIRGRKVGEAYAPFVIPEVGINHEGDFDKAIQLIDAAHRAGAECVKFQSHITEAEMIPTDMKPGGISDEKLWDILKRCELSQDEERKTKDYCEEKGLIYLCTPFSREAADRLYQLDIAAFKIGSGECNNIPLIDHISQMGKPIILSTGMNDMASIKTSVEVIQSRSCPFMLMHCTSMYPTPYEKVRLNAILELKESFQVPVGLSDHSMGIYTCVAAVVLGACVLEKHFTISRNWPGPDTSLSIEPGELEELIKGARAVHLAKGGHKSILPEEQPVIDFAYASVVTIHSVQQGEEFSLANTWVKRPGTGPIHAKDLDKVIGRRAIKTLAENTQVAMEDIAN